MIEFNKMGRPCFYGNATGKQFYLVCETPLSWAVSLVSTTVFPVPRTEPAHIRSKNICLMCAYRVEGSSEFGPVYHPLGITI